MIWMKIKAFVNRNQIRFLNGKTTHFYCNTVIIPDIFRNWNSLFVILLFIPFVKPLPGHYWSETAKLFSKNRHFNESSVSRISQKGGPNLKGEGGSNPKGRCQLQREMPTYYLIKVYRKLHAKEENLTGGCPKFYHVDPLLAAILKRKQTTPTVSPFLHSYPEIGDSSFRRALWTFKQQLILKVRAHCGISIVLL